MLSGVYRFPQMESVVFGRPFAEALAEEVGRIDARAVFVLASGTLARTTDTVDRIRQLLGNRIAGVCAENRRPYAADRCRRGGKRGPRSRGRSACYRWWRLGD